MRTRLLAFASLALVPMALAVPAGAGAETLHVKYQGLTAQAAFSSTQGCVQTIVYVLASDGRVKIDPGGPEAASGNTVFIYQTDVCTQTQLVDAHGHAFLTPDEFQIDDAFSAATLTATVEVSDTITGRSFPVHVSASWTGFGDTFSIDERYRDEPAPGTWVNFHLNGTARQATAIGTVLDGTTNLTPEPAIVDVGTRLGSIKTGQVDVVRS
jgi:hypothetical protein